MNEDVERVWAAYLSYHPKAVLTGQRQRLIESRLRDGYDTATLVAAIHGNHADDFCNGENNRGRQYHGLDLILRNADKIEQYAGIGDTDTAARVEQEMQATLREAREAGWGG